MSSLIESIEEESIRDFKKDLKFWLHQDNYVKVFIDGGTEPMIDLQSCSNIHAPEAPSDLDFTRVISIDLEAETVNQTILMSSASEVYASKENLFLVSRFYWYYQEKRDSDYSYIHQFDITDPTDAHYLGSGGIDGTPLNQFSGTFIRL